MGKKFKTSNPSQLAVAEYSRTYQIYYNMLSNIAMTTIQWEGVPEEINMLYVERTLYYRGRCLFFKDDVGEFYAWLDFTEGGEVNIYGFPTVFSVITPNGYYNPDLNLNNSVPVYANMLRMPECVTVQWYASRLADLAQKEKMNVEASSNPLLVLCPDEMRFTIEQAIQQKKENVPVIIGKKSFNEVDYQMLGMESAKIFSADKTKLLFEKCWNEAMTYLGVSNMQIIKKERLISDEVQRSQGGTVAQRNARMAMRNLGAQQINRMFGLNLKPVFRDIYIGGEDNGTLYDTDETPAGADSRLS